MAWSRYECMTLLYYTSSNSCVQASISFVCCLIGGPECALDSGCSCDCTCYDRGDCCADIAQTGCLGECLTCTVSVMFTSSSFVPSDSKIIIA